MSRHISNEVKLKLAFSSNNLCANPLCINPIMDPITGTITGQIAHIVPYSNNGPRGNEATLNEDDINSFNNLLFLCPTCHKIIDTKPDEYSTKILQQWKQPWLSLDIKDFTSKFLELVSKYNLVEKFSVRIVKYADSWGLDPVYESFFIDIDCFNFEMDALCNEYVCLIPNSLRERIKSIIQMFDEIAVSFAYKTYPTTINGIEVPIFNHTDEWTFVQVNHELDKCDYSLRQILNKLYSISI